MSLFKKKRKTKLDIVLEAIRAWGKS